MVEGGDLEMTMKRVTFPTITTRGGDEAGADEPEIVISTSDLDRDGDRILADAWRLHNYLRNPAVLWAHDAFSLPVGTSTQLSVEPGRGLRARWRWLKNDPFADRVKNAFSQGIVRGASVGFLPIASEPNASGGRNFTAVELIEWSLVPIGSNPAAIRTLKALGLAPRSPSPAALIAAVRRGVADALDPEGARLRRAVATGVRRALRENLDMRYHTLRTSTRMAVAVHKAAAEGLRRAIAASRRS